MLTVKSNLTEQTSMTQVITAQIKYDPQQTVIKNKQKREKYVNKSRKERYTPSHSNPITKKHRHLSTSWLCYAPIFGLQQYAKFSGT